MPRESLKSKQTRAAEVYRRLQKTFPNVGTFLTHDTPFQLLIAVILSAQCTDARVNMVTPELFRHYPTPKDLAEAHPDHIRDLIKSINFFNNKAKNIQATAKIVLETYQANVPADLDKLVTLPGVGRKTANVVLGQAFNIPGITVDTHVKRVSKRLGFTKKDDPVAIERDLMAVWAKDTWIDLSSTTILHGRHTCKAHYPACESCVLFDVCAKNV